MSQLESPHINDSTARATDNQPQQQNIVDMRNPAEANLAKPADSPDHHAVVAKNGFLNFDSAFGHEHELDQSHDAQHNGKHEGSKVHELCHTQQYDAPGSMGDAPSSSDAASSGDSAGAGSLETSTDPQLIQKIQEQFLQVEQEFLTLASEIVQLLSQEIASLQPGGSASSPPPDSTPAPGSPSTGDASPPPSDSTPASGSSPPGGSAGSPEGNGSQTPPQNESLNQLIAESPLGPNANSNNWQSTHQANVTKAASAAANGTELEFFGDSITYNMAAGNMPAFGKDFADAKPQAFGIGGDRAADLLYRVNHGEFQGTPKVAVINIGTNDTGSIKYGSETVQDVVGDVQKTIESMQDRSPDTKVLLMGILPRTDNMEQVNEINAGLSKLADGNRVVFDNIDSQMEDKNGNLLPGITYDGLHPNSQGYQIWDSATKSEISQMLDSPSTPAPAPGDGPTEAGSTPAPNGTPDGSGSPAPSGSPETGGATTLDTAHLKGVNFSGGGWVGTEDTWPTPQEIQEFSQQGFNTVRLEMSWEKMQPKLGGPLDPTELSHLDSLLEAGAKYGVKIIPDLHNWDRYNTNHGTLGQGDIKNDDSGTVVGTGNVSVADLGDFWSKLAEHVNANPTLSSALGGWDLMNEPHNDNGTWSSTAAAVDKDIRATGDKHTVVIEGDDWARNFNGLAQIAKQDPNVAFEDHTYWNGDGSGVYNNESAPADKNVGVEAITPFVNFLKENHVNGFVGEYGVPTNNTSWEPAVTNFIDYLAQNGVGNAAWAAGPDWGGYELSLEPNNGKNPPILDTIINADKEYDK